MMRTSTAMILTKAVGSVTASRGGPGGCAFSEYRARDAVAFDVGVSSTMPVPLPKGRRAYEGESEKQDS
jgi:hypothetical protein